MKVAFNSAEEFLIELEKEGPENNIVRTSFMQKPSSISPNIKLLFVVSTFVADGQLIEYMEFCGDLWGMSEEKDSEIVEKGKERLVKIETRCQELGYEIRSGRIVDEE